MDEAALGNILCEAGEWVFDDEHTCIAFREHNIGTARITNITRRRQLTIRKISAGGGFCWFILSQFEWKSTIVESTDKTPENEHSPHLLGVLNLEITITNRLPPHAQETHARNTMVNSGSLLDDVFLPKSFTVRIEQGAFVLPGSTIDSLTETSELVQQNYEPVPRFRKRLVFDKSPYPRESEWKDSWKENWMMPDWNIWECTEFVASIEQKNPALQSSNGNVASIKS
jgi:hypothetical protein